MRMRLPEAIPAACAALLSAATAAGAAPFDPVAFLGPAGAHVLAAPERVEVFELRPAGGDAPARIAGLAATRVGQLGPAFAQRLARAVTRPENYRPGRVYRCSPPRRWVALRVVRGEQRLDLILGDCYLRIAIEGVDGASAPYDSTRREALRRPLLRRLQREARRGAAR
jgi:hypothetical protein